MTRWRELPSMVVARAGDETVKAQLAQRFQDAIDEAAMRLGDTGTDDYLAGLIRQAVSSAWAYDRDFPYFIRSATPYTKVGLDNPDTLYFSEQAIAKAAEPKELYVIDGATHIDLYDRPQYVGPAVEKLAEFFAKYL